MKFLLFLCLVAVVRCLNLRELLEQLEPEPNGFSDCPLVECRRDLFKGIIDIKNPNSTKKRSTGEQMEACKLLVLDFLKCKEDVMTDAAPQLCDDCHTMQLWWALDQRAGEEKRLISKICRLCSPGVCKDAGLQTCVKGCIQVMRTISGPGAKDESFKTEVDTCMACITEAVENNVDYTSCPMGYLFRMTPLDLQIFGSLLKAKADGCKTRGIGRSCERPNLRREACDADVDSKLEEYTRCAADYYSGKEECKELMLNITSFTNQIKEVAKTTCDTFSRLTTYWNDRCNKNVTIEEVMGGEM